MDLQKAIDTIYEEAAYYLSIDYNESPPPPSFSEKEKEWISQLIN